MLGPKILETLNSKYSGKLIVKKDRGDVYITTGLLTQSGGEVIKDVWNAFYEKYWWWQLQNKSWLILGLATGTVAEIIVKKYRPTKIVGVEIDPVMIYLGRKYFDLDKIPNLEIFNIDARRYVLNTQEKFDYILVDMYLGDKLPEFVYTVSFLQKLRKLTCETAVFNHLIYNKTKQKNAERLVASLSKIFKNIRLVRVLTNLLVVCS